MGSRTLIGGGVLLFVRETAEAVIEAVRGFDKLSGTEMRELTETVGQDFDAEAIVDLSPTERWHAIGIVLTASWLVNPD